MRGLTDVIGACNFFDKALPLETCSSQNWPRVRLLELHTQHPGFPNIIKARETVPGQMTLADVWL